MSSITVADADRPVSPHADHADHAEPAPPPHPEPASDTAAAAAAAEEDRSTAPPQPKRRRVADSARVRAVRACQRCRRLKEKCDGRQPCQRCYRSGRDCEFAPVGVAAAAAAAAATAKDNGSAVNAAAAATAAKKAPGQQRAIKSDFNSREASLAVAETARSEERTKCLERLVQHLLGDVPLDLNNLRRMADKAGRRSESDNASAITGTDELDDLTLEDENFTVKTLSQSTAREPVPRLATTASCARTDSAALDYSGEFSHWNFSQKLRRRLSQCLDSDVALPSIKRDLRNATSTSMPNKAGMRILEYWRATQLQSPKTLVQSVLSCLPPRAVANFLVQIYFQFAQVNCFYAEETWIRKKLDFLYEAPGHVTSEDSAWVCSVLMVLAIGTQFAHMAAGPPPEGEEGEHDKPSSVLPNGSDSDVGVTFYQMASKLIPDIITIASIESVQACLLLAHYALPLDTQGLAYTYLGLGIKMAIQNGMHRRYTGSDLDAWTIETRNRLWWTAYTVERYDALATYLTHTPVCITAL